MKRTSPPDAERGRFRGNIDEFQRKSPVKREAETSVHELDPVSPSSKTTVDDEVRVRNIIAAEPQEGGTDSLPSDISSFSSSRRELIKTCRDNNSLACTERS